MYRGVSYTCDISLSGIPDTARSPSRDVNRDLLRNDSRNLFIYHAIMAGIYLEIRLSIVSRRDCRRVAASRKKDSVKDPDCSCRVSIRVFPFRRHLRPRPLTSHLRASRHVIKHFKGQRERAPARRAWHAVRRADGHATSTSALRTSTLRYRQAYNRPSLTFDSRSQHSGPQNLTQFVAPHLMPQHVR